MAVKNPFQNSKINSWKALHYCSARHLPKMASANYSHWKWFVYQLKNVLRWFQTDTNCCQCIDKTDWIRINFKKSKDNYKWHRTVFAAKKNLNAIQRVKQYLYVLNVNEKLEWTNWIVWTNKFTTSTKMQPNLPMTRNTYFIWAITAARHVNRWNEKKNTKLS